jgi:hypothetical protein
MKVYVIYDESGTIRGVAASDIPNFGVGVKPSLSFVEEEHNIDSARLKEHLWELHSSHIMDLSSDPPRRVRKPEGGD